MAEPGTATTPFTTSSFAMRRGKPFRDATKAARKRSNVRNNVAFRERVSCRVFVFLPQR
jgi:hypothetical protein